MLESRILLLGPWSSCNRSGDSRAIQTSDRSAILGYAERRWRISIPLLRLRWRPVVRLHETEDASLVCTAYSGGFGKWEVRDAEDHVIGVGRREKRTSKIAPMLLLEDSLGGPIATVRGLAENEHCRVVDPVGHQLASTHHESRSAIIEFDSTLDSDPFMKMLVLMAIVTVR